MTVTDDKAMKKIIDELKNLHRLREEADLRLIRRAHEIELRQKGVWSQFYTSFDDLLESNNLCDSRRYRNIIAADEKIGQKTVDAIGAFAAAEAVKIEDPARQGKYIEAASKRIESEGIVWSERQAEKMRKEIAGQPPRDSNYNKSADNEKRLYAENVELKKQVRELSRQIKERDEEIAKLQRALDKMKDKKAA